MADGIFPRYEGGVGVATPETPRPAALTRGGETLAAAGKALAGAALETHSTYLKRRELLDEAEVMERYMQASTEIEESEEQMKLGGKNAEEAREAADKLLAKRMPEWQKGLNPNAAFKFESKLFGRQLEYKTVASRIANKAVFDRMGAAQVGMERSIEEGIAKGRIVGDPETAHETQVYMAALAKRMDLGAITKEDAEKDRLRVLTNAALGMGHQQISTNPQAVLDMPKQSGYLKHLTAAQESQLRSEAETAKRTRERDAEHKEDRRREAMDRFTVEQREYFEADFERSLRGDPGAPPPDVAHLNRLNELRMISGEKYRFYRDAMENRLVEGDPAKVDSALVRELGITTMTVETNPDIKTTESRVMQAIRDQKVPFKQGMAWLQHLATKRTQEDQPLSMKQQNVAAKALVEEALRVTGPLAQQIDPIVQPILTEAKEDLERNAANGYPVPPLQLYFAKKAEWQTRAKVPAKMQVNNLRRSLGLPPSTSDPRGDAILREKVKLRQQYQAMDPNGPAAATVLERSRRLMELKRLEDQINGWGVAGEGPVAGPAQQPKSEQQQKPTSGAPPVPKPRVPGAR